jgi:hypothetical protein
MSKEAPDTARNRAEVRHRREQLLRVRVLRRLEDLAHRAALDDAAALHHDDVGRQVGDDAHVVRDDDDRAVEALVELPQQVEDLGLDRHVERRGGLVGDQHVRVARQRLGDHGALALAAGELVRVGVERLLRVRHLDELQQLERAHLGGRRDDRLVNPQGLHDLEAHRVHGVERRHGLLEDHGDVVAAGLPEGRLVGSDHLDALELGTPPDAAVLGQQAQQRHGADALARAGLADDREHLARVDLVVDVDGRGDPLVADPEVDAEAGDLEDGDDGVRPVHVSAHAAASWLLGTRGTRGVRAGRGTMRPWISPSSSARRSDAC